MWLFSLTDIETTIGGGVPQHEYIDLPDEAMRVLFIHRYSFGSSDIDWSSVKLQSNVFGGSHPKEQAVLLH